MKYQARRRANLCGRMLRSEEHAGFAAPRGAVR